MQVIQGHIYLLKVMHKSLREKRRISVLVQSASLNSLLALYRWFNLTAMLPLFSQHPILISAQLRCFSTTKPSEVCDIYGSFPFGYESNGWAPSLRPFLEVSGLRLKYELITSKSESMLSLPCYFHIEDMSVRGRK
jgi:hypothetical protein